MQLLGRIISLLLPVFRFSSPLVLCRFAPWCSVCKSVASEYQRAATLARKHGLNVVIARLDAKEHAAFANDVLGVERVPVFTLYRRHGATADEFPLLSTAEAIVAGLGKMLDSPLELTPAKTFGPEEDALAVASWLFWRGTSDGKLQTTLMFYQADDADATPEQAAAAAAATASGFAAFDAVAKELMRFSNLRFAVCRQGAVLDDFDIPRGAPALVLYKEHDEGRAVYAGPTAGAEGAEALRRWVLMQDTPLVTDVWHRTLQGLRRRVPTLAMFYVPGAHAEHYATMARFKAALQRIVYALEADGLVQRGNFTLGIADGTKYRSWMAHAGLPEGRLPALAVEDTVREEVTPVTDFAADAAAGLAAYIESEAAEAAKLAAEAAREGGADEGAAAAAGAEAAGIFRARMEFVPSALAPEADKAAFLAGPTANASNAEEAAAAAKAAANASPAPGVASVAVDADGQVVAAAGGVALPEVKADGSTADGRLTWVTIPEAKVKAALAKYLRQRQAREHASDEAAAVFGSGAAFAA